MTATRHQHPLPAQRRPLALVVAAGLATAALAPMASTAKAQQISFIRDTEIERLLNDYSRPIFQAAGLEWAAAGCSMCVGMNGDIVPSGNRCASTTNRNFRGRQGRGARTHLMSPAMAAAAAVAGALADVRPMLEGRRVA